jgi:hypothetical protein
MSFRDALETIVPSEIFGSCFLNPVSTSELDTAPTVNNSHRSAAHAASGGGVLEKIDPFDTVLASPTKHLSPILACSGGNMLKNEDVSPPTLEIFGTGSLDHVLTMDTGYSYLRPKTPNNNFAFKQWIRCRVAQIV